MSLSLLFLVCTCVLSFLRGAFGAADKCAISQCSISNNCRCSIGATPLSTNDTPQLIALTFDEAIAINIYKDVWQPLLSDRLNPDGKPISGTFFVPHEYTDYTIVQELYLQGFEIGVNSITKNSLSTYWSNASVQTLTNEFGGQRTLIAYFANIPIEDIVGARTPQLQLDGDISIDAYIASKIQYDSSWTSRHNKPLYPYTLNYLSTQECRTGTKCPTEAHPGFWVAPIINFQGTDKIECTNLQACNMEGSETEIATWLQKQVDFLRNSTREPLTIQLSSSFFLFTNNSYEGFRKFLDNLATQKDVFLVSQKQVVDWMKSPVPLSQFKTATFERNAECYPINCELKNMDDNTRYMNICVDCPQTYPWLGNPLGEVL